jgi:hypothetical protein
MNPTLPNLKQEFAFLAWIMYNRSRVMRRHTYATRRAAGQDDAAVTPLAHLPYQIRLYNSKRLVAED